MSQYLRPNIRAMAGYTPGEQPRDGGFIKLNTNENPYPPSPRVFEAIQKALTGDRLRTSEVSPILRRQQHIRKGAGEMADAGGGSDVVCRALSTRAGESQAA